VLYCPVREMPTNSPETRLWRKWIVHQMLHGVGSVRVSVRVGLTPTLPVFAKPKESLMLRRAGNGVDASLPLPLMVCAWNFVRTTTLLPTPKEARPPFPALVGDYLKRPKTFITAGQVRDSVVATAPDHSRRSAGEPTHQRYPPRDPERRSRPRRPPLRPGTPRHPPRTRPPRPVGLLRGR
jgi:hypothetical protein